MLFDGDSNPKRIFGMSLTFVGVMVYTWLKQRIKEQEEWDKSTASQAVAVERAVETSGDEVQLIAKS